MQNNNYNNNGRNVYMIPAYTKIPNKFHKT